MKPSILGALLGAIAGFTTVVLLNVVVISAPFLRAVFFPGGIFLRYATNKGTGDFGQMILDFLAYFSNIVLYAAVGFGLGKLFESRRNPQGAGAEGTDD